MDRRRISYGLCLFVIAALVVFAFRYSKDEKRARNELAETRAVLEKTEQKVHDLEASLRARTDELVALKQQQAVAAPAAVQHVVSQQAASSVPDTIPRSKGDNDFRLRARISAIEKFVPLTDEQKERLSKKFQSDSNETAESLDDILGHENAEYYRNEMGKAFQRAKEEDEEKDVLLLSRQLNLSEEQESRVRIAIKQAEVEVSTAMRSQGAASKDMESRLQTMMKENQLRQEALRKQLAVIFSEEQYRRYLENEAASGASDFQVWHEASE